MSLNLAGFSSLVSARPAGSRPESPDRPERLHDARQIRVFLWLVLLLMLVGRGSLGQSALAGDWPQILGPDRNGHAKDERLLEHWPKGGPKQLWKRDVGRGHAGVAVRDERVVLFHRLGGEEVVEQIRGKDGEQEWKAKFAAHFRGSVVPDQDGPLCVPVIDNDQVFLYGAGGDLHAVDWKDGQKRWSRALYRELRSRRGQIDYGYFGAGSTPIVEGDTVLVNAGGLSGKGIVALSRADGKTRWAVSDEQPSYSAPVAVTVNGTRHVLFLTRLNLVSINPVDGAVRFQYPFGKRGPTVNAASPVVNRNRVFVTASYGIGGVMARFDQESPQVVWANDNGMSSQYSTSIYHDGFLYGVDGRADGGTASLRCIKFDTGKVVWDEPDFGVATLMLADGKLLIMKTDGRLVMARPSPDGFQKLAEARLFDGTVRALPALSNGKFYARDDTELKCFQLGR
ncbi:MAG: PQQ-binding-like beta-propeller repeat protein [Pirellulales bacterium]